MRLLKRVRDFALHIGKHKIGKAEVDETLTSLDIDSYGLDKLDRKYLKFILDNYGSRAVGIDTIAAALSEDRGTLEDIIEPYLLQIGFIARTLRGRTLTVNSIKYFDKSLL